MKSTCLLVAFSTLLIWANAPAQDWAQWPGPKQDGQAPAAPRWPETLSSLNRTWQVELDASYSGPLVVGETIIITASKDKTFEQAIALDRTTGKLVWKTLADGGGTNGSAFASPLQWENKVESYISTLVVIAGKISLHLRKQKLTCFDLATGQQHWVTDKQFELLEQKKISDQDTWSHLAVSGKSLYIRELKAFSCWES